MRKCSWEVVAFYYLVFVLGVMAVLEITISGEPPPDPAVPAFEFVISDAEPTYDHSIMLSCPREEDCECGEVGVTVDGVKLTAEDCACTDCTPAVITTDAICWNAETETLAPCTGNGDSGVWISDDATKVIEWDTDNGHAPEAAIRNDQFRYWLGIVVNPEGVGPKMDVEWRRGPRWGIKLDLAMARVQDVSCVEGLFCEALHGPRVYAASPHPHYGDQPTGPAVVYGTEQDWQIGLGVSWTTPQRVKQ